MKKLTFMFLAVGLVLALAVWYLGVVAIPTDTLLKSRVQNGIPNVTYPDQVAPFNSHDSVPNAAPINLGGSMSNATSVVVDPSPTGSEHRHLKRFFKTQLKPSLREIASEFKEGHLPRISVPLFEGKEAVVVVEKYTSYGENGGAFSGKVEGYEGSFVNLAFYDNAESGSIQIPAQNLVYAIQPQPNGSVLIGEVDATALGTCGRCAIPGGGKVQ